MVELDEAIENWYANIAKKAIPTTDDKLKITNAGAKVFQKELEAVTERLHKTKGTATYNKHPKNKTRKQHRRNRKHLADDIVVSGRNVDGFKDGNSTVGWEDGMNDTIARWLNDGTVKRAGDHFVTNLQQSPEILRKVMAAEVEEYKKLIGGLK